MAMGATIDSMDVGSRIWDATVIGAGPAGSTAARALAHHGLSVLLVAHARCPRTTVCGCCLNLRALTTLADMGLGDLAHDCGAQPLQRLRLASSPSQADIPFAGVVLSRERFDAALVNAAIAPGVCFLL